MMEQEHAQSEVQREALEYIESLKPEWHQALESLTLTQLVADPKEPRETGSSR